MDHFLFKIDKERTGEFLSVTREIFLFVFVIFCLLHAPCKDKLSFYVPVDFPACKWSYICLLCKCERKKEHGQDHWPVLIKVYNCRLALFRTLTELEILPGYVQMRKTQKMLNHVRY